MFLVFFDIVLVIIRFNNNIYDFLISLNIKNEWILENLSLLVEVIFIIICLTFAYLISRIEGAGGFLLYLIFFGFGAYIGMINLYFYLGLLFNLFRRRKNEREKSDS